MFYDPHKFVTGLACSGLCIASSAGLLVTAPQLASASYNPPRGAGTSKPSSPGGTGIIRRGSGCSETEDGLGLTLLAPQEHVGQTASAYPTFVWFVPNEGITGGFSIMSIDEEDRPEAIVEDHPFTSTSGFMSFTLPESSEPLESGESYLLQVYLECESDSSEDEFVEAFVSVVDASLSPSPLAADPVEQAKQFAEAELWYDALGVLFKHELEGNSEAEAYRNQLLLELAGIEASAITDGSDPDGPKLSFSETLQRIAQ